MLGLFVKLIQKIGSVKLMVSNCTYNVFPFENKCLHTDFFRCYYVTLSYRRFAYVHTFPVVVNHMVYCIFSGRFPHWVANYSASSGTSNNNIDRYSLIYYQTLGEYQPIGSPIFDDPKETK